MKSLLSASKMSSTQTIDRDALQNIPHAGWMPLIFNLLKLKACMEMKSWISLSYTQIWFQALDQHAGSTGSEQEAGGGILSFHARKVLWYLAPMAAWVLPVSLHENWKKKGKTTTQRAMEWHSSEGRGANSNPSPWGLRWSHSITCFHLSGHITVPGAEASGMSSHGSMDPPPNNLLLQLVLSE